MVYTWFLIWFFLEKQAILAEQYLGKKRKKKKRHKLVESMLLSFYPNQRTSLSVLKFICQAGNRKGKNLFDTTKR